MFSSYIQMFVCHQYTLEDGWKPKYTLTIHIITKQTSTKLSCEYQITLLVYVFSPVPQQPGHEQLSEKDRNFNEETRATDNDSTNRIYK